MSLTIKDLEKFQADHPDHRLELVDGGIVVMSPSGYESEEVASEVVRVIGNWVKPRRLGRVTGSSAGFTLPNADLRAPDISFVRAERLRRSPRSFAELAPDLMVEVRSPSDSVKALRKKIDDFLTLGTQVGILIDPVAHLVEIYRLGRDVEILRDGDRLTLPDLLPGWEVPVIELWAPEFD